MKEHTFKNNFSAKDSGLIFSFVLFVFIIIVFIYSFFNDYLKVILGSYEGFLSVALIQISFLIACIYYCKHFKINILKSLHITAKTNKKILFITAVTAVSMLYTFSLPAFYFVEFLKRLGFTPNDSPLIIDSFLSLALGILILAILPAVAEEIMFRGIILQGLRRFGDTFAIITSALFFMLIHANPTQTLYPFLTGLVFGFVFVKTGNLKFTIFMHFINNAIIVVLNFLTNYVGILEQNDTATFGIADYIILAVAVVIFLLCLFYFKNKKTVKHEVANPKIIVLTSNLIKFIDNSKCIDKNFANKIFGFNNNDKKSQDPKAFLLEKNFEYDSFNDAYVLEEGIDKDIPKFNEFVDVSKNPNYNPYFTSKKMFFIYTAFGIVVSIALWLSTFFM